MNFLIAYDIADPRRLRKIASVIRKYGQRIEKSVFECSLTESDFTRMDREIRRIAADGDTVIAWKLTAHSEKTILIGKKTVSPRFFY